MKTPPLIATAELPSYFRSRGIAYCRCESTVLGFGKGKPQYRLYDYPGPADDETMGLFCEWHTADIFAVDTGPHIAIGLRGPVADDPHRGRGLAIGILASHLRDPANPDISSPLFRGCPDWPGGPSMFVEDFSLNDGVAPINDWQLSPGKHLPALLGNGSYRIDVHVSKAHVWAGVWQVHDNGGERRYTYMDQVACSDTRLGFSGSPCPEEAVDRGRGNAFIGAGFADPDNHSFVDNIHIAHWKNQG